MRPEMSPLSAAECNTLRDSSDNYYSLLSRAQKFVIVVIAEAKARSASAEVSKSK